VQRVHVLGGVGERS